MSEKLKDYQVLDVLCGGTFYKVRHKVSNSIYAWRAYNCSAYSDEKIQSAVEEVKIINKSLTGNFIRYYDTILHTPTKTLYFVMEYISWKSVQELVEECMSSKQYFKESFIWHLLISLARSCKALESYNFITLKKCLNEHCVFVDINGNVRLNGFELCLEQNHSNNLMQQLGRLLHTLCYLPDTAIEKIKQFRYSDDLVDVLNFLMDDKNVSLRSDVILYHPTVLANTEVSPPPNSFKDIMVSADCSLLNLNINKSDSEKAVELCRQDQPYLTRHSVNALDSPIYCNLVTKIAPYDDEEFVMSKPERDSMSPTIAALALELPGFVPRSRRPLAQALCQFDGPQRISEETLSHQWMSRMIALRQREESLNQRERELIAKEILNSPSTKLVSLEDSVKQNIESNGITLPEVITQASDVQNNWISRRKHRRASSVRTRTRRKSYAYEDLDSSLSADTGDNSIVITATKFTKDNMPRRNIFPEISTKKVHFTSSNPFAESDDSVTLTFYDLENTAEENFMTKSSNEKDINKFKYLDVEKLTSEKRAANHWSHSSPSKQAKTLGKVLSDITNYENLRKVPSKTSLTSKSSKTSLMSQCSAESGEVIEAFKQSGNSFGVKHSFVQTPKAPPEFKKTKTRKSLLPFKTPFKFKSTSTKV